MDLQECNDMLREANSHGIYMITYTPRDKCAQSAIVVTEKIPWISTIQVGGKPKVFLDEVHVYNGLLSVKLNHLEPLQSGVDPKDIGKDELVVDDAGRKYSVANFGTLPMKLDGEPPRYSHTKFIPFEQIISVEF